MIFQGETSGIVMLKEVNQYPEANGSILLNNSTHSFISGVISRSDQPLYEGYTLSVLGIDSYTSPRIAWLRLYRDEIISDEKIAWQGYNWSYNSSDKPIFYAEVKSIFAGALGNMIQLQNVTQYSELDGSILISGANYTLTSYAIIVNPNPRTILDDGRDISTITAKFSQLGNTIPDGTNVEFVSNRSTDVFLNSGTNITSNITINNNATVHLKGNSSGISRITVKTSRISGSAILSPPIEGGGSGGGSGGGTENISGFANVIISSVITDSSKSIVAANTSIEVIRVGNDAAVGVNTTGKVSINITAAVTWNASLFNVSFASVQSGMSSDEENLGRYLNITANISEPENLSSVNITFFYNDPDLDMNKDGDTTDVGIDLDENNLKIYWWNGNVWKPLSPEGIDYSSENGPKVLKIFRDIANNRLTVKINHLSVFALAGLILPVGGDDRRSSNGGGGGGASGENYSNIILKEKYDEAIYKDKPSSYRFKNSTNPVTFVNITGKFNAGLINTAVEVLKGTSTLVKEAAPGTVYKNFNIWVGTSGFSTSKNIKEATIMFRVENSWIEGNALARSEIKLVKWDNGTWKILETSEKNRDGMYTYFEGKTTSFSPFAVTGFKEAAPTATLPGVTAPADTTSAATSEAAQSTNLAIILVVIVLIAVIGMGVAVYMKRK